jgi:hypothetical protein
MYLYVTGDQNAYGGKTRPNNGALSIMMHHPPPPAPPPNFGPLSLFPLRAYRTLKRHVHPPALQIAITELFHLRGRSESRKERKKTVGDAPISIADHDGGGGGGSGSWEAFKAPSPGQPDSNAEG